VSSSGGFRRLTFEDAVAVLAGFEGRAATVYVMPRTSTGPASLAGGAPLAVMRGVVGVPREVSESVAARHTRRSLVFVPLGSERRHPHGAVGLNLSPADFQDGQAWPGNSQLDLHFPEVNISFRLL
jgi:hypothetical protein